MPMKETDMGLNLFLTSFKKVNMRNNCMLCIVIVKLDPILTSQICVIMGSVIEGLKLTSIYCMSCFYVTEFLSRAGLRILCWAKKLYFSSEFISLMLVQFSKENLKSFIIFPSLVPGNSMSLSFQTDTPGQTKKHYANMPM